MGVELVELLGGYRQRRRQDRPGMGADKLGLFIQLEVVDNPWPG
jgi:hypothetical protein